MAWVYPTADPGGGEAMILSYYNASFPYGMVAFDYANVPSGNPTCYFYDGVAYQIVEGPSKLTLNSWSHVAYTYDKQSLKLYINGALVRAIGVTSNISSGGASLYVGDDPGAGDVPLTGRMDDVRLFNRGLSASEITTLMNSPVAP